MSQPIVDEKSLTRLSIVELSHCNAICSGGKEIILLCEKVWCELRSFPDFSMKVSQFTRDDIEIWLFEENFGENSWQSRGEIVRVHKLVAITFRSPVFRDITEPVKVKIQLRQPSDGKISEPRDFEMLPSFDEGKF